MNTQAKKLNLIENLILFQDEKLFNAEYLNFKQIRERHLYLCKDFYNAYPYILRSATAKSYLSEIQDDKILLSLTAKLSLPELNKDSSTLLLASEQSDAISGISPDILINSLSFTHIIELLKADTQLKRSFYEVEAIKNNWTVRESERAMNSMLFERTGLSANKEAVLEKHRGNSLPQMQNILRNPYVLEFLDLEEKPEYSESEADF
ncbi:MAG: hypothetical protein HY738_17060 [Bacteroidia bacterium]|nr:hypothetical protein [Bacteroidia bacterium]